MTLTQLRAAVRRDLRDEDPAGYRWSDGELDRHIDHALRELSQAIPRAVRIFGQSEPGS